MTHNKISAKSILPQRKWSSEICFQFSLYAYTENSAVKRFSPQSSKETIMGLFDNLENQAVTSLLGGSSNPLAASLLQMIQNQPAGLQGVVQSFHAKGLGSLMSPWVSPGPNPPMTTNQFHHLL